MADWILYCATAPSGKRYFGITSKSLKARRKGHRDSAKQGSLVPFHKALRKYGDAIVFEVVMVGDRETILAAEIAAIEKHKTRDKRRGYNVTIGGELSPSLTPGLAAAHGLKKRGKPLKVSQATLDALRASRDDPAFRARKAAAMRARMADPAIMAAHIARMRARKGIPRGPMSDEGRANILRTRARGPRPETTEVMKARWADPEYRELMKRRKPRGPFTSPEKLEAARAAMIARNADPEFKKATSDRMKAMHADPEFEAKRLAGLKRRK